MMSAALAPAVEIKTLKINGKDVSARADQTILEVARENGINIPTLCQCDGLSNVGSCRMCLVEIAGSPRLATACVTKVEEGMDITTDSPRLLGYRSMITSMLFTERNHICSVCVSNGHCELQDMARVVGMTHVELPYIYPKAQVDFSHADYAVDHNRCILCTRCVRVCDEVEGAHTWDVFGRGIGSRVITDLNEPWGASETCTSCGKCVQVCPTGALFEKGNSPSEQKKHPEFLPYLVQMRREHDAKA
jgi:bidirectional [NiFe] hydrogenase diaphorase subunit